MRDRTSSVLDTIFRDGGKAELGNGIWYIHGDSFLYNLRQSLQNINPFKIFTKTPTCSANCAPQIFLSISGSFDFFAWVRHRQIRNNLHHCRTTSRCRSCKVDNTSRICLKLTLLPPSKITISLLHITCATGLQI